MITSRGKSSLSHLCAPGFSWPLRIAYLFQRVKASLLLLHLLELIRLSSTGNLGPLMRKSRTRIGGQHSSLTAYARRKPKASYVRVHCCTAAAAPCASPWRARGRCDGTAPRPCIDHAGNRDSLPSQAIDLKSSIRAM